MDLAARRRAPPPGFESQKAGSHALVKLAVARTVPSGATSRAPLSEPLSTESGLLQEPYPPARRNDPTVVTCPSSPTSSQTTVPFQELMSADMYSHPELPP